MENIEEKEIHYPRIYTIHSQKGGVGKTSIAIAIAGFANIFHNKNVLIIDADLTGASLVDMRGWAGDERPVYFNDVILAKPPDFAKYTMIKPTEPKDKSLCERKEFYQKVRNYDGICYVPASPCFDDVLSSYWQVYEEGLSHWIKYELSGTETISKYRMVTTEYANSRTPSTWTFEGSNNNVDWTTLDTQIDVSGWEHSVWKDFVF